jgi:hypothetical protein
MFNGDDKLRLARTIVEKMRRLGIEDTLEIIALQSEIVCRVGTDANALRRMFDEKMALARAVPHNISGWKK